ncbi:hypothetical protein HQN89_35665 [Paenibacillus frigoriresistens]|uniref:Imm26 family immunity protein n=1 Tax=Paenibacillus alginolyticus TaxID=59839 RepID=UPI0015658702|nr:Imm26 family immunity protein [Paenibacillus frigoriresistens]NRF96136.1 hypothetical protein [Paenibacillus frigoriresistens]
MNVGFVKIHLPDYTIPTFMIAQSLAEEFSVETNYDALKKLRKTLRSSNDDLHKIVKTDSEGGCVFIHASSKRVVEILRVAIVINELAIEPYHEQIDTTDNLEKVKQLLLSWKRPKPQKWKVGDIFSIPLGDGTFSFGQVLWEQYRSPNCALFDCRDIEILPIEKIMTSYVISVLQLGPENLNSFDWRIVGNAPVNIDKEQVPRMHREVGVGTHSYSAEHFSYLAKV